ncbi:uncharacterized protein BX664DRAFT_317864 [Halteromyces radiatus]|uniref:uncharacterized protein n=1 Tax=Halteromyces radiatus TaxID=101107 RepID=UPI00221E94E4|nr:uncharacterized protein BX664DRAFT_317864 [Halteromyces radiatus]KAI8079974.1 hypothetical protein BX664DRAFT_317864 [Halteromyces radiatus]
MERQYRSVDESSVESIASGSQSVAYTLPPPTPTITTEGPGSLMVDRRGKGFRRLLRHYSLPVYLIDEYKTSSFSPSCDTNNVQTFRDVPNPRPYRREERPTVRCHGLLRCTSQNCMEENGGRSKLWNGDLLGCLNMRHILLGLRADGQIPERFRRPSVAPRAAPDEPPIQEGRRTLRRLQ